MFDFHYLIYSRYEHDSTPFGKYLPVYLLHVCHTNFGGVVSEERITSNSTLC